MQCCVDRRYTSGTKHHHSMSDCRLGTYSSALSAMHDSEHLYQTQVSPHNTPHFASAFATMWAVADPLLMRRKV